MIKQQQERINQKEAILQQRPGPGDPGYRPTLEDFPSPESNLPDSPGYDGIKQQMKDTRDRQINAMIANYRADYSSYQNPSENQNLTEEQRQQHREAERSSSGRLADLMRNQPG